MHPVLAQRVPGACLLSTANELQILELRDIDVSSVPGGNHVTEAVSAKADENGVKACATSKDWTCASQTTGCEVALCTDFRRMCEAIFMVRHF